MPAGAPRPIAANRPTLRIRFDALALRLVLTGAAAAGIVLEHGFYTRPLPLWAVELAQVLLITAYWADVLIRARRSRPPIPGQRIDWVDYSLLAIILLGVLLHIISGGWSDPAAGGGAPQPWQWGGPGNMLSGRTPWLVAQVGMVALFFAELWRLNVALSRILPNPGVLLPGSFFVLIVVGTLLLKAPVAVPPGAELSWLDAAFTMTSAVCVTGLTVRDTASGFTPYGQTVIAVFIQLGGLGFIIFGSTLAMLLGRGISLRGRHSLSEMLNNEPVHRLTSLTRFMLLTTLGIELVGAALLYPLWHAAPGEELTVARRLGLSLFHSISAFCNAGFDITGESLIGYRHTALPHLVIAPLIVLGGLGFPVLYNLASAGRERLRASRRGGLDLARARLTLHTKIVLVTTAALYIYGVAAIGAGQLAQVTAPQIAPAVPATPAPSPAAVLIDASFMSITARTAGFTTVPMDEIEPAGVFTLMTLMLAGGSPGGTAGGVKTTTLALLILSVAATIRQRRETEAFGRSISDTLIRRAGTVAICYVLMLVVVTLLLSLTERASFQVVFFEAVSAATTTGLSLGLTGELTPMGRVVIIAAMFLGRVGPLALFGALVLRRAAQRPYAYAHEPVAMG